MKKVVALLVSVFLVVTFAQAVTLTIIQPEGEVTMTRPEGSRVTFKSLEEGIIKWWKVISGGVEVEDGGFDMPSNDVKVEAMYTGNVITVVQTAGGKITPGSVGVEENGSRTFTMTPNEKYVLSDVIIDGTTIEKDQLIPNEEGLMTYTFNNVTSGHTITAMFSEIVVPTLATDSGTWYTQGGTTVDKSNITSIALVDSYTPGTVIESWNASKNQASDVTAYLEDDGSGNNKYKLTIAGNGSGSIKADTSCGYAFSGFENTTSITGLNILDTSNVTSMAYMFSGCSGLESLVVSGLNTTNVTNMEYMFSNCSKLESLDVSGFNTAKVTGMSGMFNGCSRLTSLDVSGFDTTNVFYMNRMFGRCSGLTSLDVSGFNTAKVINMGEMFRGCSGLTSLELSELFSTASARLMQDMFYGCSKLESLDVSGFNTANVTAMASMFNGCSKLESLDVSGFNTANVAGMASMFNGCSGLTSLDVSGFNTAKVTAMASMFNGCSKLESLDVSGFDTSEVTTMSVMFGGCSKLESLDVSRFDTSKVTTMESMFGGCSVLGSLDVSGFNTAKVIVMQNMFNGCGELTSLDLSNFNTASVTAMASMFAGMDKLQEITIGAEFSFTGDGTTWCVLPTPNSTKITGADGNWYNTSGDPLTPEEIKNLSNPEDTYYALKSLVPDPWNAPVIDTARMVPVKWNSTYNMWETVKATDTDWYDYNSVAENESNGTIAGNGSGKWANVMTLDGLTYYNDGNSGDTVTPTTATEVPSGKIIATQGSQYVWIPRYTYTITTGYNSSGNSWNADSNPGSNKIEIKFSKGTKDKVTDGAENASQGYVSHPAFTFGDDELEGIWVAKYEASREDATASKTGSGTKVSSKPGVISWRYISIGSMFEYAYNLNRDLDSHLMKNVEWGAVAYLTNAIGRIPYINNSSSCITGNAGNNQDVAYALGTINAWNTANGVKASTTHNVYGIYDMSGGSNEYVSAYVNNGNSSLTNYASSLVNSYSNYGTKYVDVYPIGTSDSQDNNYAEWSNIKGDAVYETSSSSASWDGDALAVPKGSFAAFARGGSYSMGSESGIFRVGNEDCSSMSGLGFRVVFCVKSGT